MQYLVGRPKPVRDRKGDLNIVFVMFGLFRGNVFAIHHATKLLLILEKKE